MTAPPILTVENLEICFFTTDGVVRAAEGVSFDLRGGETLGLVGESGCGKSITALSIMRLLPEGVARVTNGTIRLSGRDLLSLPAPEMRDVRGAEIGMIFQEPMTSLNPVLTVGRQIAECVQRHRGGSWREAMGRAREMLEVVRIPDAARRLDDYPHQFSGGMRQRAMIAMALSCDPTMLIADEPTTALDVTIQAQILRLMQDLRDRLGMTTILITHDLGVVAEMCDRVAVMYSGKIVEKAPVGALFREPAHPYTRGLLGAMPRLGGVQGLRGALSEIPGSVPSLRERPRHCCQFAPRCSIAKKRCGELPPELRALGEGHLVSCWEAPLNGVRA